MKVHESESGAGKDEQFVKSYSVCLNPKDNGGESMSLDVDVYDNGDIDLTGEERFYTNLTLRAHCYGTSAASISMWGVGLNELAKAVKAIQEKYEHDFGEETK